MLLSAVSLKADCCTGPPAVWELGSPGAVEGEAERLCSILTIKPLQTEHPHALADK